MRLVRARARVDPRLRLAALRSARSRRMPISDMSRDAGLFGPASVTWPVMAEPALIAAGGAALLLQMAHPLVAQGALDHSMFAADPWGRLERTMGWVTEVAFGSTTEAERACERVNRIHVSIGGDLPSENATKAVSAHARYTALDAGLLLWVHASLLDTMLRAYELMVRPLSREQRDRFVREWNEVGRRLEIPPEQLWSTAADLRAYVDRTIAGGDALPGAGSREVARTVLHPPIDRARRRAAFTAAAFVTVGLLPDPVRAAYGIPWSRAHAAAHRIACAALRGAARVIPDVHRRSPVYDFAMRRAAAAVGV